MEENQQGQDVSQEINKLLEASPQKKKNLFVGFIVVQNITYYNITCNVNPFPHPPLSGARR